MTDSSITSNPKSSKFSHSVNEFKLNGAASFHSPPLSTCHSPGSSISTASSGDSSMASSLFDGASSSTSALATPMQPCLPGLGRKRSTPFGISRRQSNLASEVILQDDLDPMQVEPMVLSDQDEDDGQLGSPFMSQFGERIPKQPITSPKWSRAASISFTADKSFNPLNPTPTHKTTDGESRFHNSMDTSSPMSNMTPRLARAKSSPSLSRIDSKQAQQETPIRSHALSASRPSFDGLGVSLPLSGQGADGLPSPTNPGTQRRVVQRRASLFPKIKAHQRVAAQLADEEVSTPDMDEVLSEAALHRLNSSRPASQSKPQVGSGLLGRINRFPESAPTEEEDSFGRPSFRRAGTLSDSDGELDMSSAQGGSGIDLDDMAAPISLPTTASAGLTGQDVENWRQKRDLWLGFREKQSPGGYQTYSGPLFSNRNMDVEMPPAASNSSRPNKRKVADSERYEPYFKRRGVSPTASLSPALASPTTTGAPAHAASGINAIPMPPPPTQGLFSGLTGRSPSSRGGSPAPLSSSFKEKQFATGSAAALGMMLSHRMSHQEDDDSISQTGDLLDHMDMRY